MAKVEDIITKMTLNPRGITYQELRKVCIHYFGTPRQSGGSHEIFKSPWHGDPRLNIQNSRGMAKSYQVKQILTAIRRLEQLS